MKDDPVKGRSYRRNKAAHIADVELAADWLFFLDADDVMHPECFRMFAYILDNDPNLDAVFGLISCKDSCATGREVEPYIRDGQPMFILGYRQFLDTDPFLGVQMGHFVRTKVFNSIKFDESMDCGEDYKYYLELWCAFNAIKVPMPFFTNVRGTHSQGPRSATGARWSKTVSLLRRKASREYETRTLVNSSKKNEEEIF